MLDVMEFIAVGVFGVSVLYLLLVFLREAKRQRNERRAAIKTDQTERAKHEPVKIEPPMVAEADNSARTILDQSSAESLHGHGGMLDLPPDTVRPGRMHGTFVPDEEVHGVVEHLKPFTQTNHIDGVLDEVQPLGKSSVTGASDCPEAGGSGDKADALYAEAAHRYRLRLFRQLCGYPPPPPGGRPHSWRKRFKITQSNVKLNTYFISQEKKIYHPFYSVG